MKLEGGRITERHHTQFGTGIAHSGSRFGVTYAYYYVDHDTRYFLQGLVVDAAGTVVVSDEVLANARAKYAPDDSPSDQYAQDHVSNLVWNAEHGQFAVALWDEEQKVLKFLRLDAQLQAVGAPTLIEFPGLPPHTHPSLLYPSVAYNAVSHEYGVTYVTVENENLADRHDDVWLSRVNPSTGATSGGFHAIDCPHDCRETALIVHPDGGKWVVAYGKRTSASSGYATFLAQVNLAHHGQPTWASDLGMEVLPKGRLEALHDSVADRFVVVGSGNTEGVHMQCVSPSGAAAGVQSRGEGSTFGHEFSLGLYASGIQAYWGTQGRRIEGLGVLCDWFTDAFNVLPPDPNNDQWAPAVAVDAETAYVAWLQADGVYFGSPKPDTGN